METRPRSSMFFASDVSSAAETAAYALEEHGLTVDQVDELVERLEETIATFFGEVRDRPNAR